MPHWGIFPSFSHGGDRSLTYPLQFPSLGWDILYSPHWPLFLSFSSIWALSGASFKTRRVPLSHFQRIEICSGMPHWGIPPSLSTSAVLHIFLTTQSISWSLRVIILGHTPFNIFLLGQPSTIIYVWGIPLLSFSFGASPTVICIWGIPPLSSLFRAFPVLVTLFRASPYFRFV